MLYTYKCEKEECPNDEWDVNMSLSEFDRRKKENDPVTCPVCDSVGEYQFHPTVHVGEKVKPGSEPKIHKRLK
jgi:hypothetical protein